MLIHIIMCSVVGLIVGGISGISLVGWAVGIFLFLCGLPGALIGSFVDDSISYAQDRADYRQMMSDFDADMRAEEHEDREDARTEQLMESQKGSLTQIYNDHRQVHLHGGK